jgi:hypothetical protein
MQVLPVNNYPSYSEEVVLDSTLYVFTFNWNYRAQYWTVTVKDRNNTTLISGVKLMSGIDIFSRFGNINLPRGLLIPLHNTGISQYIEDGDMGVNVDVIYITEAERVSL